jgi:hypothetical protein
MAQRSPLPDDQIGIPPIDEISDEEARAYFDAQARRLLGVSGDEFLDRYEAGEYWGETDFDRYHKINELIMIMPFACEVTIDDDGRFRPVR